MKTYTAIGAIVGTGITVVRLIKKRDELFGGSEETTLAEDIGSMIGLHLGNLINVFTWPVSLVLEVKELIQGK